MTADVDKAWTACPRGALDGIVLHQRSRRRNVLFREAAGMIMLAAAIGFAIGYFSMPGAKAPVPQRQMFFAGISCQSVHNLLPAMMRNELDAARTAQVRDHVMQCPECRRLMEQMRAAGSIGATLDQFSGDAQALASALRASPRS